ncbi:hypothetical protein T440DRAFT_552013 [Plenodomus tracheiphilus IPT5]|uniref:WHIM1 domain-containing protein n=1 Tax=Plenodomus tracheiphilus IPT5 TaxID=1408161 RepID=A0A6A7BFB9_9PLEO|nr:hypothetical protein T440DRAFT_552013 [Plenodomus tracheiphilus IPT5]
MADSDSSLSSPPATDDEMPVDTAPAMLGKPLPQKKKKKNGTILTFFKHRSPSPPPRKRPASPPHEYVPEDNPDIAFIVMFRSRFNEAFPRGAPHVGPQDIEQGVTGESPSADVEGLLCALLGLVLNRKKPVEKGHYGRALEEAIQTQKSQWPRKWTANPLSGGRGFKTMTTVERITLLHTLALWSLNQNEQVRAMIADAYKARTTKDRLDTNIPLSVQPWGRDGDKRRYWLVEGQNDTHFRIYRETDPKLKNMQWLSVAGSIEELQVLAKKLDEEDGHREAKALGERMLNAVPRFEASEVKRKRREYRVQRTAAFTRPGPDFPSLYEGRTRGKRQRYNYADEEDDFDSEDLPARRSGRQSGRETSAAPSGPTVTASGRQVRSRATGLYGEILHSGQVDDRVSPATGDYTRSSEEPQNGRATRAGNRGAATGRPVNRTVDSDEEDATSWDGGDEEEDEPEHMDLDDDEDDAADDTMDEDDEPQSLMVTLRYRKDASTQPSAPPGDPSTHPTTTTNGNIEQNGTQTSTPPLAAPDLPRQTDTMSTPVQQQPQPTTLPANPPQPTLSSTSNSLPTQTPTQQPQHPPPSTLPIVPTAEQIHHQPHPDVLPKLEGFFAPTPPYSAPYDATMTKLEQQPRDLESLQQQQLQQQESREQGQKGGVEAGAEGWR